MKTILPEHEAELSRFINELNELPTSELETIRQQAWDEAKRQHAVARIINIILLNRAAREFQSANRSTPL